MSSISEQIYKFTNLILFTNLGPEDWYLKQAWDIWTVIELEQLILKNCLEFCVYVHFLYARWTYTWDRHLVYLYINKYKPDLFFLIN